MAELRQKIVLQSEAGDSPTVTARNFRLAHSTEHNVKKLFDRWLLKAAWRGKTSCSADTGPYRDGQGQYCQKSASEHPEDGPWPSGLCDSDVNPGEEGPGPCIKGCGKSARSNPRKITAFSDEKNFFVDAFTNRRNTRYLAEQSEDVNPHQSGMRQRVRILQRPWYLALSKCGGSVKPWWCMTSHSLPPGSVATWMVCSTATSWATRIPCP